MWKTYFSRCIYDSSGIQIYQNRRYRWLTFGTQALQSLIDRRHPERPGLDYIHAFTCLARTIHGSICLLGLGGAGVAHALMPHLGSCSFDGVESNLDVIEVGVNFFFTKTIKPLNIIHQDAFLHVKHTSSRYQHLLIDLFTADAFPNHCNNDLFFQHCHHILLPGGFLAVNLANPQEHWRIFNSIRTQFNQCTLSIPIKRTSNLIILAYKGDSINTLLNLLHSRIKHVFWDAKWGCVAQII